VKPRSLVTGPIKVAVILFAALAIHESAHMVVAEELIGETTIEYVFSADFSSLSSLFSSAEIGGFVPFPPGETATSMEVLAVSVAGPLAGMLFAGALAFSEPKSDAVLFTSFFLFVHQLVYLVLEPAYIFGVVPVNLSIMIPMGAAFVLTLVAIVDTL
jgi:hypothetical protein